MKKTACALLLSLLLLPAAAFSQDVLIRVAPPRVVVEHPAPPPERGFIWLGGYHRWEHNHYVWVPGHYERPPHEHAVWVGHRWAHRGTHWVFIEGHWR